MAKFFDELTPDHIAFVNKQQMFFVATAGAEGRVNLSPKGLDSLRIADNKLVHWLNLTGSGNETAAHVLENQRMTLMLCSFAKAPLILRIYGTARMTQPRDAQWSELIRLFPEHRSARQVFSLDVDMVQTSCGYAVPFYEFSGERDTLTRSAQKRSHDELEEYWQSKNSLSVDGKETGI
ncbi:MAG: pyridoxamine 5'-phosphate oxidase family protein [Pseudomonadota bacterium]